jgi:hypothetical protein
MNKHFKLFAIALLAFSANAYAQESSNPIDTLAAYVQKINNTVTPLSKLKISGYFQFQAQKADSLGIKSFAGGDFNSKQNNRFGVRRGRIKFAYAGTLSNYVVQFDITEKGLGIKDAYMNFTEPWLQTLTVTGGVFNKPFGYEIPFSSSMRESPERSRFTQTLFPGERDLGAMLTIQMPKTSPWNFIKIDAGYFAGNGTNPEFDNKKDFIGHIGISKATPNEKIKYGLGASYYNGGVYQGTANYYTLKDDGSGVKAFIPDASHVKGSFAQRQYMGLDAQFSIESPIGITTLRGEYATGTQPGSDKSTSSPTSDFTVIAPKVNSDNTTVGVSTVADTYLRKFKAGYVYFVQSINRTPLSLVVKYDFYDPNTDLTGNEIGKSTTAVGAKKTGSADLKYTTTGIGLLCAVSANVKLTLYYDMVKNETTNSVANFSKDLKDNVITFRMQYKF